MKSTSEEKCVHVSDIFSDFQTIVSRLDNIREIEEDLLRNDLGRRVLRSMLRGGTFSKYFCDVLLSQSSDLYKILFEKSEFDFERRVQQKILVLRKDSIELYIDLSGSKQPLSRAHKILPVPVLNRATFFLSTDFLSFFIYSKSNSSEITELVSVFSKEEFLDHLIECENIFELCLPSSFCITSRTLSFTMPADDNSVLFSANSRTPFSFRALFNRVRGIGNPIEETALAKLNSAFGDARLFGTREGARSLQSLSQVETWRSTTISGGSGSQISMGQNTIRMMDVICPNPISYRQKVIPSEFSQDDILINYNENGLEYEREFLVTDRQRSKSEPTFHDLQIDLGRLIGVRRSGLFRQGFAKRVYSVLGLPVYLESKDTKCSNFVLLPILNLYRVPDRDYFRNTFTVNICIFPISEIARSEHMMASPRRLSALESALVKKSVVQPVGVRDDCDLGVFLVSGSSPTPSGFDDSEVTLSSALKLACSQFLHACGLANRTSDVESSKNIDGMVFEASLDSNLTSQMHLVDWANTSPHAKPWAHWLGSESKPSVSLRLYKFMYCQDYLSPTTAYTSSNITQLKEMVLGNNYKTDLGGLTLFDETSELKCIFFPITNEQYPKRSILRWMTFSIFQDSAVSSMRAMVYDMHSQFAEKLPLGEITTRLSGTIESFGELFDLDIRRQSYKEEYIVMRDRLRINNEYEFILKNYNAIKDSAMLREQKLFNILLTSLTIVTLTFGFFSFVGQADKWKTSSFIFATLPVLLLVGAVSFRKFDALRKWIEKG